MNSTVTELGAFEQDNVADWREQQLYPRGRYSLRGFLRFILWLVRR
jgi:hypothetical protein